MNLPNFKDILKIVLEKLSVLKNNISVMISIIIALLALLLFIPTQLLSNGLKKEIQSESIKDLAKKIPEIQIISEDDMENARKELGKVTAEANDIALQTIQTTKRELLRYDIFQSDPNDPNSSVSQSIFFQFGKEFCGKIDQFIEENNARMCLSSDDVETTLENIGFTDILSSRGTGSSYDSTSEQSEIEGLMIEQICKKNAESSFIYIDPAQISGYSFWSEYQYSGWDLDVENCWYSQLGYWIIEDIFDTIAAMNDGNENLTTAPVKRLMKVYFNDAYEQQDFSSGSVGIAASNKYSDSPTYIFAADETPTVTPTGRYSDGNYDVVHFGIKLVVNTDDLFHFINELCSVKEHKYIDKTGQTFNYKHNQISVLDMTVKSVNLNSEEHNLCWYGNSDVSEVRLTCEYLFHKKGYEDVMPKIIKNLFGTGDYN